MDISINKNELKVALDLIASVAKENKIRPILSGVLIKADEKIKLIGTDLEKTIIAEIQGNIIKKGSTLLDINELLSYVKVEDSETIDIYLDENEIVVNDATFGTYEVEDYPRISIDHSYDIEIDRVQLIDSIENVISSVGQPDNLAINGVRIDLTNNAIVSTDTYRMTLSTMENDNELQVTIPQNAIQPILKALKATQIENIKVYSDGNQLYFEIDNITLGTRIIDLAFPEYERILESMVLPHEINFNKKELETVVKKLLIFVSKNPASKNVAIFNIKDNKVKIEGKSDKSKIKQSLDIINVDNIETKIALNVQFLADYLKTHKSDTVIAKLKDHNMPLKIESKDNVFLSMPVSLRQ